MEIHATGGADKGEGSENGPAKTLDLPVNARDIARLSQSLRVPVCAFDSAGDVSKGMRR